MIFEIFVHNVNENRSGRELESALRPGKEFYQPVLRAGDTIRVAVESANRDSVGVLAGPADGVVVSEDGADREFDGLLVSQRTGMQVLPLDQLMETLWGYW